MTVLGTVRNGTIVLDSSSPFPDGTRVKVDVMEAAPEPESLRDLLMRFAGTCTGLPSDMAQQHDHYIHGTSKR